MRELISVRVPADTLQESKALITISALPSRSYEPISKPSIDLEKISTMGYAELFGESADQLVFTHGENRILVDEQYCMKPSCDCKARSLDLYAIGAG